MKIDAARSILLVIDLQARLLPVIENGATVLENASWLVDVAQTVGVPVRATEQYPQGLGPTETALRRRFADGTIIEKTCFSAVIGSALLASADAARTQWIIVGAEAHVCVQQTVLDLLSTGREAFVVDEAVGSRRAHDRDRALRRMERNGAEIVTREMVAFEWLARADTPMFRDVLERFLR
jgi:nicotinamidase-related amidase